MSPTRIATWNINGLRARLDFVLLWLDERKPDLLGLQELKMSDDKFPHDVLAEVGYHAVTHGQKSWNGVAVLAPVSRELLVTQEGLPDQAELGARLLTVKSGDLSFTTVYCPNGKSVEHDDYQSKLAWFESLADHFSKAHDARNPTVLCGDFNICPSPLDSWNEEKLLGGIFHTEAERARMQALFDWGFSDLYRALHPDGTEHSWWDYRGGAFHKKQGLRIDFVLASKPLLARTSALIIDREWRKKKGELTASDHCPVFADLSD